MPPRKKRAKIGTPESRGLVTTPDSVFWQRKAYNDRLNNVYIKNNAGTNMQLNFDSRSTTLRTPPSMGG